MSEKLLSANNHADLTCGPLELWSAPAPHNRRDNVPGIS